MSEEKTLEEAFSELDELIQTMEEKNLPLEDTFKLYKEGISLVEFCSKKIEKVECDIKVVNQ